MATHEQVAKVLQFRRKIETDITAKHLTAVEAKDLVDICRDMQLRLVATNGVFDLLHLGHLTLLSESKKLGDLLIVAMNSDKSVHAIKGPNRPICDERTRRLQLQHCHYVDMVVVFDEESPGWLWPLLRPAVVTKGCDFVDRRIPEMDSIERYGGRFVAIPGRYDQTTRIVERILRAEKNQSPAAGTP